jgi:hypothetical protein
LEEEMADPIFRVKNEGEFFVSFVLRRCGIAVGMIETGHKSSFAL